MLKISSGSYGRILSRRRYEICVVGYAILASIVFVELGPLATSPTIVRILLTAVLQVIGILTGFMATTYVFWIRALIDHFREESTVLEPLLQKMRTEGATMVRYKSPLGLVGSELERDISAPYAPPWFRGKVAPQPGDDWRVMVDGYQELQNRMLRRAYLWMFTTLVGIGALSTAYAICLAEAEAILNIVPLLSNFVILFFTLALAWLVTLMRLLLRPGGGVVVVSVAQRKDGSYTLITPF